MQILLVIVSASIVKADVGYYDIASTISPADSHAYSLSNPKAVRYRPIQRRNYEPSVSKFENGSRITGLMDLMIDLGKTAQESGIVDTEVSLIRLFVQQLLTISVCSQFYQVLEGLTISPTADRVGVILYSSSIRKKEKIKLGSINDAVKLATAIKALPFLSGITSTGAALKLAMDSLKARRSNVRTSVVVMTDGFSYDTVNEYAAKLRRMPNVSVYTVAIGEIYVRKELEAIAGTPNSTLYGSSSYGQLVKLIKKCNDQPTKYEKVDTATVHYTKTVTDSQGRHLIPIPHLNEISYEEPIGESTRVSGNNLESSGWNDPKTGNEGLKYLETEGSGVLADQQSSGGSARTASNVLKDDSLSTTMQQTDLLNSIDNGNEEERNIKNFAAIPTCRYDIVLVFDASGSLKGRFGDELEIAIRLIDKLVIGPNDSQIAVIKYAGSGKSRVILDFNHITAKKEIKKRIARIKFLSGTTCTNEALLKAASVFSRKGARPSKAKPIAIVFTDGYSTVDPTEDSLDSGARFLHNMGVMVFVIGMDKDGKPINRKELELIAGHSSRVYTMSTISEFERELCRVGKNCLEKAHSPNS
ncbi:unnamed protein product [Angiostrongylus costaricensis]|uniref:VWFA domain-containing protein n=1 Tax=Angiostrongylus costaricensis TaxID=334426 RepID=A0A158PFH5_ANGCS|nr:unnamed protein product [Angiostrongylus costaricensis]